MDYDKFRRNNYKQSTIKIATHYTTSAFEYLFSRKTLQLFTTFTISVGKLCHNLLYHSLNFTGIGTGDAEFSISKVFFLSLQRFAT